MSANDGPENVPATTAAPVVPPPRRRPGFQKGQPRPPGAGRKPGQRNKATRDVREATQLKGAAALRELWKLCTNAQDEKVRKAALDTWLAYAFGRPVDRQELTGADGAPFNAAPESDRDLARLLAYGLQRGVSEAEGEAEADEAEPEAAAIPAADPPEPEAPAEPPAEPLSPAETAAIGESATILMDDRGNAYPANSVVSFPFGGRVAGLGRTEPHVITSRKDRRP